MMHRALGCFRFGSSCLSPSAGRSLLSVRSLSTRPRICPPAHKIPSYSVNNNSAFFTRGRFSTSSSEIPPAVPTATPPPLSSPPLPASPNPIPAINDLGAASDSPVAPPVTAPAASAAAPADPAGPPIMALAAAFGSPAPTTTARSPSPSRPKPEKNTAGAFLNKGGRNTFVSSWYKIDESDITSYLDRKGMLHRMTGGEVVVKLCPFCHDHKDKADNMWKLYISRNTGAYMCQRCGKSGSWFDFKRALGDIAGVSEERTPAPAKELALPNQKLLTGLPSNLRKHTEAIVHLTGKELPSQRHLSAAVVKLYKVGATTESFMQQDKTWKEHVCVTFPWIVSDDKGNQVLVRYKLRAIDNKAHQRLEPKGGGWGLFGWHTVPPDAKEIVLTEGEYDAMACYQQTKVPTVSLPNGCRSLPVEVLPQLERFEKIYLWMDDDVPGQEGAQKFAYKLGVERCYLVTTKDGDPNGPKDANDALRMGKDLKQLLAKAQRLKHHQITTFEEMRNAIYHEVSDSKANAGVPSLTLPALNRYLKGHRRGELTVVTGPTGIGKTSLLSQLSLDFAMQGVNTLWGSFEIKNTRLAKKMLNQFAARPLDNLPKAEFDKIADQFLQLPMYFLRFQGSTRLEQVLDAMDYAVYCHDVEHIILDNLQFLLSGQGVGFERFELQDRAVEAFRRFATSKNVHISLVIHPRKQDEDTPLSNASVFGTAKATQEADNVLIVQKGKHYKYLEVKKNRFDGELGVIPLKYERDTNKFYEIPPEELKKLKEKHIAAARAPTKRSEADSSMPQIQPLNVQFS